MTGAGATRLSVCAVALLAPCATLATAPPNPAEIRAAITADPEGPGVGARWTELAESLLAPLSIDGADTACLFGVPTDDQESRARVAATDALDAARRAAGALDSAIAAITADSGFATDRALQDRRSELAVDYLLVRLPLIHARSAALLAALETDGDRAGALSREVADALANLEPASTAITAAGLSLRVARGAGRATPSGADRLIAVARNAGALRSIGERSPRRRRETIAAAALALAASGRVADGRALIRDTGLDAPDAGVLDGVAARDALALIERRTGSTARAIRALASSGARADDALAALALAKIHRLLGPAPNPADLPPEGRLALAERLLDSGQAGPALDTLASAWSGLAGDGDAFARRAGWALATGLRQRGDLSDIADAGLVLLNLSRIETDAERARAALVSAVALLRWAYAAATQRPGEMDPASVRPALTDALRTALSRLPLAPEANQWRLTFADLLSGDERRAMLESIRPGSVEYARARLALAWLTHAALSSARSDALREAAAATMLERADEARSTLRDLGEEGAGLRPLVEQARAVALAALRRYADAADAAFAWDDAGAPGAPDAVAVALAGAEAGLDEAVALGLDDRARALAPTVERLARRAAARVGEGRAPTAQADAAAIALSDALAVLGRAAEGRETIESLAASTGLTRSVGVALARSLARIDPERAFAVARDVVDASRAIDARDDLYWQAWAVMLEILAERPGVDAETITRQITRLRAEDERLGGGSPRRRLEAIERGAR